MIHKLYKLIDSKKIPVLTEWVNKDDEPIRTIVYGSEFTIEKLDVYDEKNRWIAYIEKEDEVECRKELYTYDDKDRIVKQDIFVYGELFEEVFTKYTDNGIVTTTISEGEETYKEVETTLDEKTTRWEYFDRGHPQDYKITKWDKETGIQITEYYDVYDQLKTTRIEKYNEDEHVLEMVDYDTDDRILSHYTFEYQGKWWTKGIYIDYSPDTYEEYHEIEYDKNGNVLKHRIMGPQNLPFGFIECSFNDNNQLLEEYGIQGGRYSSISVEYLQPDEREFHFIHEYEEE